MHNTNQIPTSRIEALSDGVIAIISVMVFDLKLHKIPMDKTVWTELITVAPRLFLYTISFWMLAIMWVTHHQKVHQITYIKRRLLWHSFHLLFWMSLVPFETNFNRVIPLILQASFMYGIIFLMGALLFAMQSNYATRTSLLDERIHKPFIIKIIGKKSLVFCSSYYVL